MPKSDSRKWNGTEAIDQPSASNYVPLSLPDGTVHWVAVSSLLATIGAIALQASTPGTIQTGHGNISGTFIAGRLVATNGVASEAILGTSTSGYGVHGVSTGSGAGVMGESTTGGEGVHGKSSTSASAVLAEATGGGPAAWGKSTSNGPGVKGESTSGPSAFFQSNDASNTAGTVIIRKKNSGTANLLEIQDSSGTLEGYIDANFIPQGTLAPSGAGTVTSVALTVPSEFSVSGSPVTTSGTLAVTKANQNANLVFAGPTSGSAAAPTFRALVAADIPTVPAVTAPLVERWLYPKAGTTTRILVGINSADIIATGTVTNLDDATGTYHNFATTTSTNDFVRLIDNMSFTPEWLPRIVNVIKTGTDITSVRIWCGMITNASPYTSDDPAGGDYAAFRYSTAADGTAFWRTFTKDGTTSTVTTTTAAIAADTKYILEVRYDSASSVGFYVNNALVATHTTHLPRTSLTSYFSNYTTCTTLTSASRSIRIGKMYVAYA